MSVFCFSQFWTDEKGYDDGARKHDQEQGNLDAEKNAEPRGKEHIPGRDPGNGQECSRYQEHGHREPAEPEFALGEALRSVRGFQQKVDIHDRAEPDNCGQHVKIADDEAGDMLGHGERTVEALGLYFFEVLLPLFRERTAANRINMAPLALKPRLSRILRSGGGLQGKKGDHPEKTNEHPIAAPLCESCMWHEDSYGKPRSLHVEFT